jgi:uncharacterized YigZ family protein
MTCVFIEPRNDVEIREVIQRSQFFGIVRCARDENSARVILSGVGDRYRNATHICYAYRIGFPKITEFATDAGEPSGTAGRPILGAIQRTDLANTLVVIVRFFGGIKLGVRGLIEAYGFTASEALRAAKRIERKAALRCFLRLRYDQYSETLAILRRFGCIAEAPEYAEDIRFIALVPLDSVALLREFLDERLARGLILECYWGEDVSIL